MISLIPAYGRDYKSKKAVEEAFNNQVDFRVSDVSSPWDGKVANKKDLVNHNFTEVKIRYAKLTKVHIFKIEV